MAAYDALELRLSGEEAPEYVRIPEGSSIDAELDRFIKRTTGYESGWVKVMSDRYIRYDHIVSVEIRRDLDDESGHPAGFGRGTES